MPNIICTSDYTISDFNDAISLSGYIGSNLAHTQIYSPDNGAYTPDWHTTNLVLTPQLYVTSTTTDIIATPAVTSVKWYLNSETPSNLISNSSDYNLNATTHVLTVLNNILAGADNVKYICVIVYHDSTTNLDLTHKMDITFTKVKSGSGIADAICIAEQGNIFKNGNIATLKASCDLWRGSLIDDTNVTYQWYIMDPSVETDEGGGIGWKRLTLDVSGMYTGVTTREITVYAAAVPNIATFKCIITDTAANNAKYYDTITFTDLSDPIQCTIVSSGGDTFVNGQGSTILTARLFRSGAEIDPYEENKVSYDYTYKWYKYNSAGVRVDNWGGSVGIHYKTGKTLSVGSSDVSVKATFRVEVE